MFEISRHPRAALALLFAAGALAQHAARAEIVVQSQTPFCQAIFGAGAEQVFNVGAPIAPGATILIDVVATPSVRVSGASDDAGDPFTITQSLVFNGFQLATVAARSASGLASGAEIRLTLAHSGAAGGSSCAQPYSAAGIAPLPGSLDQSGSATGGSTTPTVTTGASTSQNPRLAQAVFLVIPPVGAFSLEAQAPLQALSSVCGSAPDTAGQPFCRLSAFDAAVAPSAPYTGRAGFAPVSARPWAAVMTTYRGLDDLIFKDSFE